MISKMILRDAKKQIRLARQKAAEAGEEWDGPQKPSKIRDIDEEYLKEIRKSRKQDNDDFRAAKRRLNSEIKKTRASTGTFQITWQYQAGSLVKIKESAYKRYSNMMDNLNISAGDVGIIVEPEDTRYQGGKTLHVMGPMGLQQWDASWVISCDE